MKKLPSQKYLQECFTYNKNTGELIWKKDRPMQHFKNVHAAAIYKSKYAGLSAGYIHNNGYIIIHTPLGPCLAHRLIWKFIYNKDSVKAIDHINRNRADNRLENLREVTIAENGQNRSINKKHSTGYKGVSYDKFKKKWYAKISVNCTSKWLGFFTSPEEAHLAYCAAAEEYFGKYSSKG